jgi:hypothetical protein
MPRLTSRSAPIAWIVGVLLLGGLEAGAVEPVQITVEGRAEAKAAELAGARDQALQAAIVEAVVGVARDLVQRPLSEPDVELLRESLAPRAAALILTYRIEPGGALRPIPDEPELYQYVVRVTAAVDASALRRELDRVAFLGGSGGRPSVLVRVRGGSGGRGGRPDVRLEPLERAVRQDLRRHEFVVLDPGVLPGAAPEERTAVELARSAGADVAVDVDVGLRRTGIGRRIVGVVAQVTARAIRVQDGFELARVQMDTPAYHTDPDEAAMRALDAAQEPLARNLRVQLERNWGVLASERGPLSLVVRGVTGFSQVMAVWEFLSNGREVEGVQLRALGPGRAEFSLREAPSSGVLQSRLARAELPGFRLEPLAIAADRLELTVRELPRGDSSAGPGSPEPGF